jgi:AcrR family transcriptional regulator
MGAVKQDLDTILEVAQALAAEGPGALTMRRLAEQTGLSRATLYRQVGNKAQLLARLAEAEGREFIAASPRERILHAARRVFGREGIAAATVEQIAQEAGVGVATVYRLFGSKEGLLRVFAEEVVPRAAVRERTMHPTENLTQDLEAIVRVMLAFFYENRDMVRMALLGNEAERRYLQGLRQDTNTTLDYLAAYFHQQMDAGRLKAVARPQDLALALIGMVLAFAVIGPLHYGTAPESIEAIARLIVTLLLENLR